MRLAKFLREVFCVTKSQKESKRICIIDSIDSVEEGTKTLPIFLDEGSCTTQAIVYKERSAQVHRAPAADILSVKAQELF